MKCFTYWNPFGLHLFYCHQVDHNKNRGNSSISLEITWAVNFFTDCSFAYYLAVTEVHTALPYGHFQNYVDIMPTLTFQRHLAIHSMKNYIGSESIGVGRTTMDSIRPQIVECHL